MKIVEVPTPFPPFPKGTTYKELIDWAQKNIEPIEY